MLRAAAPIALLAPELSADAFCILPWRLAFACSRVFAPLPLLALELSAASAACLRVAVPL